MIEARYEVPGERAINASVPDGTIEIIVVIASFPS
jgi:hypothetical protein